MMDSLDYLVIFYILLLLWTVGRKIYYKFKKEDEDVNN